MFHTIPDLSFIDMDMADDLSNACIAFIKSSNSNQDEVEIEIPK